MKIRTSLVSNSSSSSFIIYGFALTKDEAAHLAELYGDDVDMGEIRQAFDGVGVGCLTDWENGRVYIGKVMADSDYICIPLGAIDPAVLQREVSAMQILHSLKGTPMILAGERST